MKLTTKGQYGIKAMFELALPGNESPQPIKAIAERQDIPEAYLEQLIGALRKSGLVKSVRGAQGGYLLSAPPDSITVGQVLRALEGKLAPFGCLEDDTCHKAGLCPTRTVWRKIHEGINRVVDGITLQDMVEDYERMLAGTEIM
jgi:Rrf2 family protein